MDCKDCPRMDHSLQTCKDGKLNPQDFETARELAQYFGARALCVLNDFREQLLDINAGKPAPYAVPRPVKAKRGNMLERP